MSKIKSKFNDMCNHMQKGTSVHKYNECRLFNHFSLLCRNRFRWEGLPNGVESRFIEEYLFYNGEVMFFVDDKFGLMCLPSTPSGTVNPYGEALSFNTHGINYTNIISSDDGVRVLANDDAKPLASVIAHYSELYAETEQVMRMNLRQQKKPYIIPVSENNRLSMKNLMKQIDDGEESIFVDKDARNSGELNFQAVQTLSPYLLDKLQQFKKDLTSELETFLGFNNANTDKKERLIKDEVNANNELITFNLELEYKNRLQACKMLNEKFGLNVSVVKVIEEKEKEEQDTIKKKEVV